MRACPRCGDLSGPAAVTCESDGCGALLVPADVARRELRAQRRPRARGQIVKCGFCGMRSRGGCSEHADLDDFQTDLLRSTKAAAVTAPPTSTRKGTGSCVV
jgi:hypothetical protein